MGAGASLDSDNGELLDEETKSIKAEADRALQSNDLPEAELLCSKAILKAPEIAMLWSDRANVRLKLEQYGQAFSDALTVIELAPVWPLGYYYGGCAALKLDKALLSNELLKKAIALAPGVPMILEAYKESVKATEKIPRGAGNNVVAWSGGSGGDPLVLGFGKEGRVGIRGTMFPKMIGALRGNMVSTIACGMSHTAAVTDEGDVYSWGRNVQGQCGIGVSSEAVEVPQIVPVLIGRSVRFVSCGAGHTIVTTANSGAWSWGIGVQGQLGHGDNTNKPHPVRINAMDSHSIKAVECGIAHSMVLSEEDAGRSKLYGFGWNKHGQLGLDSAQTTYSSPTEIKNFDLSAVSHVSCGGGHTAVVLNDGTVWTAGSNTCGQCGQGNLDDVRAFTQVKHVFGSKAVALTKCGEEFTIFVTQSQQVFGCGLNNAGQVSTSLQENFTVPTLINEMEGKGICSLACSQSEVYAISNNGEVFSWGIPKEKAKENQMRVKAGVASAEHISAESQEWAPKKVSALRKKQVTSLVCGRNHFVAIIVATKASLCYVQNHEDKFAEIESGRKVKFKLQSVDASGNERKIGGDSFLISLRHNLRGEFYFKDAYIDDNLDGTFDGSFKLPFSGEWSLGILYCNQHILDSPFLIDCKSGRKERETIDEENRKVEEARKAALKAEEETREEETRRRLENERKQAEAKAKLEEEARLIEEEMKRLKEEEERAREEKMREEERKRREAEKAQEREEKKQKWLEEEARREAVRKKMEDEMEAKRRAAEERIRLKQLEHEANLKKLKEKEEQDLQRKRLQDEDKRSRVMEKLREEEMSRRKKKEELARKSKEEEWKKAQKRTDRNEKRTGGGWVVQFAKSGGWVGDAQPVPTERSKPERTDTSQSGGTEKFKDLELLDAPRPFGGKM